MEMANYFVRQQVEKRRQRGSTGGEERLFYLEADQSLFGSPDG
jgi:hypothetical protein